MGVLTLDFDTVANSIFLENKKTNDTYCFAINNTTRDNLIKRFACIKGNTKEQKPGWTKYPVNFGSHITIHTFLDSMKNSLFTSSYPLVEGKFKDAARGKIIKWIANSQVKRLAKPISEFIRNKMQATLPEKLIKLEKRIFSVVGPKSADNILSCIDALNAVNDEIIYNDLMKYPAACIEAMHNTSRYYLPNRYESKRFYNWMQSFAPNGKLYGNLTKTLINVKGIQGQRLYSILNTKLERPITNQLELRVFLYYLSSRNIRYIYRDNHVTNIKNECFEKIFMFASAEQIKKVTKIASRGLHRNLDLRRRMDISAMVSWLNDYPEIHNGNIVGLAEKSLDWHRTAHLRQISSLTSHEASKETAKPPIELPKNPKIHFLDTVKRIHEESLDMQHCILSYANQAIAGHCYLFHIEHNNEKASAQVNPDGQVVQCYGPQNVTNSASKYGTSVLGRWGIKLRNRGNKNDESFKELQPTLQNQQVDDDNLPF